ncbi:MAG: transcriptional repressor [Thermoleophilia bacterium]
MTVTRNVPALPVETVDEALAALRASGMRISGARRLVVEALFAADGPQSAEEIRAAVEGRLPGCDLASVYRNLDTLEELGMVRHVHLGHGPGLYGLVGHGEREYLVCADCQATATVAPAVLDAARDAIRAATGYEASFQHFPIVGRCSACAAHAGHGREDGHAHP